MLNWFYDWIAGKSELYQKAVKEAVTSLEEQAKIESSNRLLTREVYQLSIENSQLRIDLEDAETSTEIESRKGDFLEERVDELTEINQTIREKAISKDIIEILLQRVKAPLVYIPSAGNISYNLLGAALLKGIEGKGISDLDLSGWSSIPIRDIEGCEIGRFYSNSNEKSIWERVHEAYTSIMGKEKAKEVIQTASLAAQQHNP